MQIQRVPVSKIKPAPYNPRVDLQPGDPKYESLKRGIEQFGCVEPLVWNARSGNLVGGHQRFKILQEQGAKEVDVSVVDLPEEQEKALNIALNKLDGEWDDAKLAALLDELTTLNEIRERFHAQLPTIRTGADALSRFVDICTAWIEGVLVALSLATRLGPTDTPIILDDLLRDVEGCFGKRLKQARSDLLGNARDADCRAEIRLLLRSVIRGLRALIEAAAAPAVVLGSPSKRRPSLLAVRQQLLSDLDELTAMRSQLEERPFLSDQREDIWKLLDGQALLAKEIAKRLGCGASSESVRRQIAKMRLSGCQIRTVRGKGYVREDAPPPDSA